ncbi:MAG: secretion protein [Candidatus Diapherotrites archaeon]|uniref:Secretion protein n=1 Tax=Candidatus Iainarchaeum sp. TaxID=3101447 RepID=A0A2D6LQA2_9ARCH|nr:secretion protein [Candidatus Diapherotrites archaeon]
MAFQFAEKKGNKIDSYGQTVIYEGFPFFFYDVKEPSFNEEENIMNESLTNLITGRWSFDEVQGQLEKLFSKQFMEQFREKIIKPVTYSDALEYLLPTDDYNTLKLTLITLFKEFLPSVKNHSLLADKILGDSIGYGKINSFVLDESLEEVMVNGYDKSVFVFHKKYGHCKTNVDFVNKKSLDSLLQKVAHTVGKNFDADTPLLDARLPDGNRANATFPYVTPFGPSLTIRKFSSVPLSIIDLIANNTVSSELAAFLWVMVEGMGVEPMNIIITGGSGSGKTTTLNALTAFVRYPERIISIEDTLELRLLGRQNWVQMESRPAMKGQEGITMDDLLKNAMRMRPDRIVVGEVRGKEAETLFVAMDTGHKGSMGTLHSNSAKEMLLRLQAKPMGVPDALIPLLNLIVVQYRLYVKGKGIQRRIISVTEVSSMDKHALLSNVYEWDRRADLIRRTDVPMKLIEILSEKTLKSKKEVEMEVNVRKRILEWMLKNEIHTQPEVEVVIQQYYYNPEGLLEKVLAEEPQ